MLNVDARDLSPQFPISIVKIIRFVRNKMKVNILPRVSLALVFEVVNKRVEIRVDA